MHQRLFVYLHDELSNSNTYTFTHSHTNMFFCNSYKEDKPSWCQFENFISSTLRFSFLFLFYLCSSCGCCWGSSQSCQEVLQELQNLVQWQGGGGSGGGSGGSCCSCLGKTSDIHIYNRNEHFPGVSTEVVWGIHRLILEERADTHLIRVGPWFRAGKSFVSHAQLWNIKWKTKTVSPPELYLKVQIEVKYKNIGLTWLAKVMQRKNPSTSTAFMVSVISDLLEKKHKIMNETGLI